MIEIWKDIIGYEDSYSISNLGHIKSKDRLVQYPDGHYQRIKGKFRKPTMTTYGYLSVKLSKNNVNVHKHIHDLVAEAFIPNPLHLLEVNHKDLDKTNNCVDNLEWCTHQENMHHMFRHKPYVLDNLHKTKNSITQSSTVCLSKTPNKNKKSILLPISREQLKNEIRTKSFLSIGKDFLVSDNTIRKWCKKYQLPYRASDIKKYTEEE